MVAARLHDPRFFEPPYQPGDLRAAQPGYLLHVGPNGSPPLLVLLRELLGHQDTLDPPVHLLLALAREADALVALQELLDLLCRQPFSVLHAYLHPAAERLPAHSIFMIILYWKQV